MLGCFIVLEFRVYRVCRVFGVYRDRVDKVYRVYRSQICGSGLGPEVFRSVRPKPETLNPKPQTLNPKPQTLNPKPWFADRSRGYTIWDCFRLRGRGGGGGGQVSTRYLLIA